MAVHLSTLVGALPGIGAQAVKDLKNLGVVSVRDLLLYFPYRYDDFSIVKPIPSLRSGDTVTVTGVIKTIESRKAKNRKMTLTEALVENESGTLKVMWFNQPYLEKTLRAGKTIALAGTIDSKFGITLVNPIQEPAGANVHTGRIVPVYGRSKTLTIRRLRSAIDAGLRGVEEFSEWLPEDIRQKGSFPDLPKAIRAIHFPENREELEKAIARLKFDELFLHQLLFAEVRQQREVKESYPIKINESFLKEFVKKLPFTLTDDQKRAAWEVVQDSAEERPMNRLLEGDVGSGKTVVAAMGIAHTLQGGFHAAYLAPTEILAGQQQASLSELLDAPVALLTGSRALLGEEEVKKKDLLEWIASGEVPCVVGTHALLQQGVEIPNLGFVVIDEQHRFGVQQRHALFETGDRPAPHLLSMTATPIPRSLALTLYGDLDLSIIKEMPKGRKPIKTALVLGENEKEMWRHVNAEIDNANRIYVVCPLIDPSDKLGARSVTETAKELKKGALKGKKIELLHGKLKAEEKVQILEDFRIPLDSRLGYRLDRSLRSHRKQMSPDKH